jgi:hypothetical protein
VLDKLLLEKEYLKESVPRIDDILNQYSAFHSYNLDKGITLLQNKALSKKKPIPSAHIAKPFEAKQIAEMYRDVYKGTYPYRELEDESAILRKINNPNWYWIVFNYEKDELIGCIAYEIDEDHKSGTFHGLVIRREYQGKGNIAILCLACLVSILVKYKSRILLWSCEVRSAHVITQALGAMLGILPIAFLPNKDLFYGKEESEFLIILYDENALDRYRSTLTPKIVYPILRSYAYAFKRYNIGKPEIVERKEPSYDEEELEYIQKNLYCREVIDAYGNENLVLHIKNRASYFECFYNRRIHNIEQSKYEVSNKEELYAFIQEMKNIVKKEHIRYFECFASAYEPDHQNIFIDADFEPFGYIPSYKYNKKRNTFEDQIIFVLFSNEFTKNLKLIKETLRLLEMLKPNIDFTNFLDINRGKNYGKRKDLG